jgi:CUB domain
MKFASLSFVLALTLLCPLQSQARKSGRDSRVLYSNYNYCDLTATSFPAGTLSGTIQSLNYPSPYVSSAGCSYTIEEKPGWGINLWLEDLDTEVSSDFLSITHYPTTRSGEVGSYGMVIAK